MDKMREEFEAWCEGIGFTLKPNAFCNGDYAMGYGWEEWNAWKASRAALCVEIPKTGEASSFGKYVVFDTEAVKEMLDVAGVSYK